MVNATVKKAGLIAAGVGALNWGLGLVNFNVLSYVPAGGVSNLVVGAIGVAGGWLLYATFKNQI